MSKLRKDPLTDRWVIIAENRAERPDELMAAPGRRSASPCPFCAGQEHQTPPAVATYVSQQPSTDPAAWQVRVVPNKFPAVQGGPGGQCTGDPMYETREGFGAHEVIVESPSHVVSFSELSEEQARLTFVAYRDRFAALKRIGRLAYGLVFKNARADGGASLEHSHSQLVALAITPPEVQYELTKVYEYQRLCGQCLLCEMLAWDQDQGQRIVAATPRFVAFCPYASRFPFETWVAPRTHRSCFEAIGDDEIGELSKLVRDVIVRFESCFDRPAYNYWLHSAPFSGGQQEYYHWRIEIAPRLTRLGGFELGAGCFINPRLPEEAASRLRSGEKN